MCCAFITKVESVAEIYKNMRTYKRIEKTQTRCYLRDEHSVLMIKHIVRKASTGKYRCIQFLNLSVIIRTEMSGK